MLQGMRIVIIALLISLGAMRKEVVAKPPSATAKPEGSKDSLNSRNPQTNIAADPAHPLDSTKDETIATLFTRPRRSSSNPNSHAMTPDQYYLQLMSMLAAKENMQPKNRMVSKEAETDFVDEDDEDDVIELYGSNPYPFTSVEVAESKAGSGSRPKVKHSGVDTIALMRSRLPAEQRVRWS